MADLLHDGLLLPAVLIFLVSGALQGASGFGMAVVAVPLLATMMPPQIAIPATVLASIVVSLLMIFRYRQHCDWNRAAWLGVPALLLAPLGVHLLKILTADQLRLSLGVVLIASTLLHYLLARNGNGAAADLPKPPPSRVKTVAVGGISGVIGGALGMTGPLLADHLIGTGIKREDFNITLNLIFLASSVWRTGLYFVQNVMTGRTLMLGLIALPAAVGGALLGGLLGGKIKNESFAGFIHLLLLAIGIWMLIEGARGCAFCASGG